jgi:hypothetical protein
MATAGRIICARDSAKLHFVFAICARCSARLKRLPDGVQNRMLTVAISQIEKYPSRYNYNTFPSRNEAMLFCRLTADLAGRHAGY